MFYSQFILAKKGPLGTIWIAAHLERKLRKNQVADTDIGDSVDSILSPDVPIALRLSSHLLLGVVRIYNKKVNYLFDDCSEALLKVKQAFRSTAVDLPPEQSKAPYHSITLPETFDLDDFELPDNEIFQGNYVDHHVSSKEQITLQDTMDGAAYLTTQFGLDERFGDGDTSGLDLDEDLFLNKVVASGHAGVSSSSDPLATVQTMMAVKQGDQHEETANSEPMIGGVDEVVHLMDDAQAPRTPGLVEEPNLSNAQETSACDDHFESEHHHLKESAVKENLETLSGEIDIHNGNKHVDEWSIPYDKNSHSVDHELSENGLSKIVETSDFPNLSEHVHEGVVENCNFEKSDYDINGSASTCQQVLEGMSEYNHKSPVIEVYENLESAGILGKSQSPSNALDDLDIDYPGLLCREKTEGQVSLNGQITGEQVQFLRPCNANFDQRDLSNPSGENATLDSVEVSGLDGARHASETCLVTDGSEKITRDNNMGEGASDEGIPSVPDLPSPEKLMSVPEGPEDVLKNLVVESTPRESVRNDVGDAGTNFISGKKRSYTESTLTEQSLKSVESSRIVRNKRTVDCIPDDDDLLSSILAGRRSSVLKVKPSPLPWEMASMKRTHSAPRTSAVKRKVLMDATMVLHGDTIRLQLMNTEDIRRVRKKAPCTCPEITIIQKQFLEDGIFLEPVNTGVSIELASLHNQTRDLSGIRISLDDINCASLGTTTEITLQNQDENNNGNNLNAENCITVATEIEPVQAPSDDMNKQDEDNVVRFEVNITQPQTGVEPNSLLLASPEDVAEPEINVRSGNNNITAEVNVALPGLDESSLRINQVSCDRGDTSATVNENENSTGVVHTTDNINNCKVDTSLHVDDAPDLSHDQNIEKVFPLMDATGVEVVEGHDTVDKDCDHTAAVETETKDMEYDSHSLVDEGIKQSILDSLFPGQVNMHAEDVVLDHGEHSVQEIELTTIDADISAAWDHDDLNYFTAGNDTEFLNVDDDDDDDDDNVVETSDDNIPNEAARRIIDNGGWSSRTRAVSHYLQALFAKQAGNARPTLSMDSLLVGKTRKEASRMFFEALVLKTKDYIHVEQGNPFENISINPRTKLMKSDF